MSVRKKASHWSIQKLYTTHHSGMQRFTDQWASTVLHTILNSQPEARTSIMLKWLSVEMYTTLDL